MEISALNLIVVDSTLHTNIQSAVNAALVAPRGAVWIPSNYAGSDSTPVTPGVPILDMRSTGTMKIATLNSTNNRIATAASAAQLTAATGGTFATTLNLPGSSVLNGVPFKVRSSGWCALSGGTYTATVQPQIWASGVAGYTASAAAAIFTFAATNITIATALAATLIYIPWEIEVQLEGDSTSAQMTGRCWGSVRNQSAVQSIPTTAATATWNPIQNSATFGTLDMSASVPVQFLTGCVNTGAFDGGASPVNNLNSFYITQS